MDVSISLDKYHFNRKPVAAEIAGISKRISSSQTKINILQLADMVGNKGHSFCPAIFTNRRSNDNFQAQQLFPLDFDNTISYGEVKKRASSYNLDIIFSYETFSSINMKKFRVVFAHIAPITDRIVAKIIINALLTIFPEADTQCNDVARLYFGGMGVIECCEQVESSLFKFDDLIMNLCAYFMNACGSNHYHRKIVSFCMENKITLNKMNLPDIKIIENHQNLGCIQKSSGNLVESPTRITIIHTNSTKLPTRIVQLTINPIPSGIRRTTFSEKNKIFPKNHKDTESKSKLRNFNYIKLEESCILFKKFVSGDERLHYQDLFGIATNLRHNNGGIKRFMDIINSPPNAKYKSYQNKPWAYYFDYWNTNDYAPTCCDNFCKYRHECTHSSNMIASARTEKKCVNVLQNHPDNATVNTEVAKRKLERNFAKALSRNDNEIHIIQAQTGIGKSTAICNYLKEAPRKCLIAVPTIKLKHQLTQTIENLGIPIMEMPSLDDYADSDQKLRLNLLYIKGAYKKANKEVKNISKEDKRIEEYLNLKELARKWPGHIITTHKGLLLESHEYLKDFDIIIDEDILSSMLKTESVLMADLIFFQDYIIKNHARYANLDINAVEQRILFATTGLNENEIIKVHPTNINIQRILSDISDAPNSLRSNIEEFLNADYLCKIEIHNSANCKPEFEIKYLKKHSLPQQKVIILSATANEELYSRYFPNNKVRFYKCAQAQNKGNVFQCCDESFSRRYLDNNGEFIEKLRDISGNLNIITFKNQKQKFDVENDIHFGKTEGFNCYEGQDIIIVGTPFMNELEYRMYAAAIGNEAEDTMRYQEVSWSCYKFWIMTYSNELMRLVQFWKFQSELEQSVGRARLLWHDCNVYLFSAFPVKQSQMVSYEEICSKISDSSSTGKKPLPPAVEKV